MKQSISWANVAYVAVVPVLLVVLLFAAQFVVELSVMHMLARVGTLGILGLTLIALMPMRVSQAELHKLFHWLYMAALFPFALYYLWLPDYSGGFPVADFFVNYGVQLLYTLILTSGIVVLWKLPQIWQRWSFTAVILIGGSLVSNLLVGLLP